MNYILPHAARCGGERDMSQKISGHTKGKWTVCTDNVVQIGATYFVAPISPDVHMSAADARLIAAAPCLLAALEVAEREIIDAIEAQTGREFTERDATRALHKVRAAIAKART
jgi:hypothetical protein